MTVSYSTLLKLNNIVTGTEEGTWGDITNTNICTLIEQAIAGTASINVGAGNVTLSDTDGASNQARCMIIGVSGSPGTSRNIIAPNRSKVYVVANGSNASVVLKTSTSTGLTIPSGEVYMCYYDTTLTDFVYVGQSATSANTANKLVLRDGSGNFAAGTITATNYIGGLDTSVTAVTQSISDDSTKVATTAFVQDVIAAAVALLGTMSSQNANNVNITGGTIANTTNGGSTTAAANALGYLGIPQNGESTGYTLALTDAGGHVYYTGGAATITIPTNASVAFPVGSAVTIINNGTGSVTIGTSSLTVYFAGTSLTGNRTLATKGMATVIKVATDTWFISGAGLS